MTAPATEQEQSVSCVICYGEDDPPPIQSGCGCRAETGLAHVACRVRAAEHQGVSSTAWWQCPTCRQSFTGQMNCEMAVELWERARDLPEDDASRLSAAQGLAHAFSGQGKYAQAEALLREVLAIAKRLCGENHPNTLLTAGNVALSLSNQGKYADAEALFRDTVYRQRCVLGAAHPSALTTSANFADCLAHAGKLADAEAACRDVLTASKRVKGDDHPDTLMAAGNLASYLSRQVYF